MGVKGLIATLTLFGSMSVSVQLHTYPFLNPRLTLTCYQLMLLCAVARIMSVIHWGQSQYQLFRLSYSVLIQINSRKTHNKSEPKPKPNHIQDGFAFSPRASHRRRSCLLFHISHPLQRVNLHQTLRTEKFFFKATRN